MLPVQEDLSLCGCLIMCCFMPRIAYSMKLCFRNALLRSHNPLHGCNVMRQLIPTIKTMWKRNLLTRAESPYPHDNGPLSKRNDLLYQKRFNLPELPLLALSSVFPHLLLLLLLESSGKRLCYLSQGNSLGGKEGILSGSGILQKNRKNGRV